MNCYHAAQGRPKQFTPEEEQKFVAADNLFRGAVISTFHSKYEDNYIIFMTDKQLWDALDAQFGVSDAGSELYIIEQLYDYKIVDNRSVVEQAHEIEQFPCVLPDKFVADSIIAKLPPFCKDFATSSKPKR
jgi:hypothetical protein